MSGRISFLLLTWGVKACRCRDHWLNEEDCRVTCALSLIGLALTIIVNSNPAEQDSKDGIPYQDKNFNHVTPPIDTADLTLKQGRAQEAGVPSR